MKKLDVAIHVETNVLKGITVKHARILVLIIKKMLHGGVQRMYHLSIRTGLALTTRNMGFGLIHLKINNKLSSIALNITILSH